MARYSQPKIRRLLDESDNAPNSDVKGEKLEDLARYLFEKISGVSFYRRNILDANGAHELDVTFWNEQPRSQIFFLDAMLMVECKNTAEPVGSREVGWFVRKLQDRGAFSAVLISLSGITGAADGARNAHSEILTALTRERIKILVLTREEIENLASTQELISLLQRKFSSLTLDKLIV